MVSYKVTQNYNDSYMTSLVGEVNTTYDQLKEKFGHPIVGSGDGKVNAEWIIKFSDGLVATIYDWKKAAIPFEEYNWHIGGKKKSVVNRIKKILEE